MSNEGESSQIYQLNKEAWDTAVDSGDNPYTQVVSTEEIAQARKGNWSLFLSDCKPVPKEWFPELHGGKILCLASGGGQQAPIFAALGAEVTLVDASSSQLAQDRFVAERDNLVIEMIEGDIADLSVLQNETFDLIFNPPSTLFVPDLAPVWRECFRVLRRGGILMTGFMNPDEFIFDHEVLDNEGAFVVKYPLPYVEHEALNREGLAQRIREKKMFHFSHTMDDHLGGLMQVGFVMTGFYEDRRPEEDNNPIWHFIPSYYIARLRKPENSNVN